MSLVDGEEVPTWPRARRCVTRGSKRRAMVDPVRAGDSRRSVNAPFRGQPLTVQPGSSGPGSGPGSRRLDRSGVGAPALSPAHRHRAGAGPGNTPGVGRRGSGGQRRGGRAGARPLRRRRRSGAPVGATIGRIFERRGALDGRQRSAPGATLGLVPAGGRHVHRRARLDRHRRGASHQGRARARGRTAIRAWRAGGAWPVPTRHGRS